MQKNFEGSLKYTFKCSNCQKTFEKIDSFKELMIPIPTKYHSHTSAIPLQELLKNYFSKEYIEDYKCECCQKKSKFEKTTTILKYPEVLILVFNIFNVVGQDFIQKLQKNIEVPLYDLNLKGFEGESFEKKKSYNLDSFISHYGESVDHGHYIR